MALSHKDKVKLLEGKDAKVKDVLASIPDYVPTTDFYDEQRLKLDGALLEHCPFMGYEMREEVLNTGKSPYVLRQRDGRTGWAAKVKEGQIILDLWSAGKLQTHMRCTMPIGRWPVRVPPASWNWGNYNLALGQFDVAYNTLLFMARRVFNEDLDPVSGALEADEIVRAIRRVIPDERPELARSKKRRSAA